MADTIRRFPNSVSTFGGSFLCMMLQDQLRIKLEFCPYCGTMLDSDLNTWELTSRDLTLLKSLGEPISEQKVKEVLGEPTRIDDIFGDGSTIHWRYASSLESGTLILVTRNGADFEPIVVEQR